MSAILSLFGLGAAAVIGREIFYTALVLEVLVYVVLRNHRVLLYYRAARLFTYILYLSFYLETGLYMSYGGDDFSFYNRHLHRDYTLGDIFSGVYFNYPWFYIVNKFFISLVPNISENYAVVYLASFNNILWALIVNKFYQICQLLHLQSVHLIWWFTPLLVTSSVLLRDVWIYYCFISVYHLYLTHKLTSNRWLLYVLISFLTRPESGLLILVFILSTNLSRYSVIYMVSIIAIMSPYFTEIMALMRDYDTLQEIYFENKVIANTNEEGIAVRLQEMKGIVGSIMWAIYTALKPLPPIVFTHLSLSNLILAVGNYFNYIIVLFTISKLLRMPKLLVTREYVFFIFGIVMIAFIGGTHRHVYHFMIPLLLLFGGASKELRFSLHKTIALSSLVLAPIYLLLK